MYYRYKPKRKKKKQFRFVLILTIIILFVYSGYRYRHYLIFWEYKYNKLIRKFEDITKINDIEQKRKKLIEICNISTEYKNKYRTKAKAFFLCGKVHYKIGETYLTDDFSGLLINNYIHEINTIAEIHFIEAIKNIKKGIALVDGTYKDNEIILLLSKAFFYTKIKKIRDVHETVNIIELHDTLLSKDDMRFYCIINILNGNTDYGIKILKQEERIKSINDILFLATTNKIAKRFTDSILEYKRAINMTTDKKILKLVHSNLGEIYFNQSLFQESLYHFRNALKIDERDNAIKIWIGKNYSVLGDKTRARAIWKNVLISDQNNIIAKRLLGLL